MGKKEKDEFCYKGINISRSEFESWPVPICVKNLSDDDMSNLAKDIYSDLIQNYGWHDKYLENLLNLDEDSLEKASNETQEDWEALMDNIIESEEHLLISKYGARYYEDIKPIDDFIEKTFTINDKNYSIYRITLFKDTKDEREILIASESLECLIEEYIEKGKYEKVRNIDENFEFVIPNDLIKSNDITKIENYFKKYFVE